MIKSLNKTTEFLQQRGFNKPEIGIILGSGMGQLVEEIEVLHEVRYNHIPNFPTATVEFHKGKLIYGRFAGKTVMVMQGRFHYYEGYSLWDVTYPVRIMKQLGIKKLIVTNASGALNPDFSKGELMLLDDHINLQNGSPLAFRGVEQFGSRFTDMSRPYDSQMNRHLEEIAREKKLILRKGVYVALTGPQLETRAEYRFLRLIGGDAVGMSTVPEVIVANHLNLPVAAISILTDEGDPDNLQEVSIEDILSSAAKAEPELIILLKELLQRI